MKPDASFLTVIDLPTSAAVIDGRAPAPPAANTVHLPSDSSFAKLDEDV